MDSAEIAVVVRYNEYENVGIEDKIQLLRSYRDEAEALQEAARLNQVRRNDHVFYFVKFVLVHREV